jgi:lipopolysaccharide export system ATP-binding protein
MEMALLEAHDLVKRYGRRTVVDGVNFTVKAGEVVGLLGSNGAGKTTSFRMVTGLIRPNTGQVFLAGSDVTHWPMYRRARLGMGYLSQETSIFRKLTVEQNLLAILETMPVPQGQSARTYRRAIALDLLNKFGLVALKDNAAHSLSGGEKRRLEIARCLVTDPALILLDEPFTGIDPKTISDIQEIVLALRDEGIGILLTDHNVDRTLEITNRAYVIRAGKVFAHGSPAEIVNNPEVREYYLGHGYDARNYGGAAAA